MYANNHPNGEEHIVMDEMCAAAGPPKLLLFYPDDNIAVPQDPISHDQVSALGS